MSVCKIRKDNFKFTIKINSLPIFNHYKLADRFRWKKTNVHHREMSLSEVAEMKYKHCITGLMKVK